MAVRVCVCCSGRVYRVSSHPSVRVGYAWKQGLAVHTVSFRGSSSRRGRHAYREAAEDDSFQANIIDNNFTVKQTGILIEVDSDRGYIKLKQGEDYKYYNFKFEERAQTEILTNNTLFVSKKDDKYGFVDKDGNVIVDYLYDDVTSQNVYGFAGIKKDGKWGSIDNKGNVIIEPTYNLDNYLLVDFIGRWHLGQDINMNYYNQLD